MTVTNTLMDLRLMYETGLLNRNLTTKLAHTLRINRLRGPESIYMNADFIKFRSILKQ
jgi:hypothetical protein